MYVLITFEGLDGAGKSTQIERLRRTLEEHGRFVVVTREPGGTDIGDAIRTLLLDPDQQQMAPRAEALLYAASRAQLLHQVVRPALARGEMVLCDRYVDASLAYQGAGLEIGVQDVIRANLFATEGLRPDLTFLFDVSVSISQSRVHESRGDVLPDRIERRNSAYFHRVRNEFMRIAADESDRVVVLDATRSPDELEQEIWQSVENHI
jgi:dTMP kinase